MMDPEIGDVHTVSFVKSGIIPRYLSQAWVLVHINSAEGDRSLELLVNKLSPFLVLYMWLTVKKNSNCKSG